MRRSELKEELYVVCLNQLFISTLTNRRICSDFRNVWLRRQEHTAVCTTHLTYVQRIFTKIYRAELITTSCDVLNHVILHDKHILRETREHPSTTMLILMSCCSTSGCCPLIQVWFLKIISLISYTQCISGTSTSKWTRYFKVMHLVVVFVCAIRLPHLC